MDKHLLAENPRRPSEGGLCVVRTVHPIAMFEIIEGWKEVNSHHRLYSFVSCDGLEERFTLRTHHYFTLEIDTADEATMFKHMDDAWYWFKSYMEWEDSK